MQFSNFSCTLRFELGPKTFKICHLSIIILSMDSTLFTSTAVGQAVGCAPVTQRAQVRAALILQPLSVTSPTSQLILQPFRRFYLRHSPFSNPSVASPMSQLILQAFRRFTYVTAHSPTLPLLHLCHSSFSNPSYASLTSQAFHLRHLASRPCY